ncbi:MAG: zf-HC2 domain-containing protein [Candidatus Dormibacteria bacterium]
MKCSLLTLSCYLDDELEASRRGELEAHLVGCTRCRGGLEHLTEETKRIAALAPAHVPDHSVHALLEQLRLIRPDDPLPERADIELDGWGPGGGPGAPPWQRDRFQHPAPLTARRDDYLRRRSLAARESGGGFGADAAESEPDGDPSGAALGVAQRTASPGPEAHHPRHQTRPALELPFPPIAGAMSPAAVPSALPGDPSVSSTWTSPPDADPWTAPAHHAGPPDLPAFAFDESWEADTAEDFDAGPPAEPQRAVRPGLLGRARERVAMYRALSRGPVDDFDDSVQVVSGTGAPLRGRPVPAGRRAMRGGMAAASTAPEGAGQGDVDTHLTGTGQAEDRWTRRVLPPRAADPVAHPTPPAGSLPGIAFPDPQAPSPWLPRVHPTPPVRAATPAADAPAGGRIPGWGDAATRPTPAVPTTAPPSGADEPGWVPAVDYSAPRRSTMAGSSSRTADAGADRRPSRRPLSRPAAVPAAMAGIGRHAARLQSEAPRRLLGAVALVGILALVGLLTGRSVTRITASNPVAAVHRAPAPAAHSSAAPVVVVPPNPSAAAPSAQPSAAPSAAPASSAAPVATTAGLTDPHLLGDGSSGYGLQGVRYGAHPGDYRVVFDLASPSAGGGTPRAVVGTHDARTVWVELFGVSGGAPAQPDGTTVIAVTLLPRATVAGATVYALTLVHPVTVSAGYVLSPVRLVLDLH